MCRVQAISVTFIGLSTYGACVMLALFQFWSVIWHMTASQRRNKIQKVYRYFSPFVIIPTIATGFIDIGPLAAWCWIKCDEINIDNGMTNHGKCWYRLIFYYICYFKITRRIYL